MLVIGWFQLVLNYYHTVASNFASYEITRKRSNFGLFFHQFQVHLDSITELGQIISQPRREIGCFVWP